MSGLSFRTNDNFLPFLNRLRRLRDNVPRRLVILLGDKFVLLMAMLFVLSNIARYGCIICQSSLTFNPACGC